MSLHHTREISDMRSAYDNTRRRTYISDSDSDRSYRELQSKSDKSYRTQSTPYSSSLNKRPPLVHNNTCDNQHKQMPQQYFDDRKPEESPRSSVESCPSTVQSEEELPEELPEYDVPEYTARPYESSAIAASPSDFSELFPSRRRLAVCHDDSTIDGNMNLRVDTEVSIHGRRCDMTLFHLRMHDLKNREFSLRRYCRDSGREVCHSALKQHKSSEKRPGFSRSLSNALTSMRPKSEQRNSTHPSVATLKRNDSGYGSMHSVNFDEDDRPRSAGQGANDANSPSTNTMKLEFSNYAQVDVKRTGVAGTTKRYIFEYWGVQYSWKRVNRKDSGTKEVSHHLTKGSSDRVLAYITHIPLSERQAYEEQRKGGWIPPCSMWIADENIVRSQKDLADVVVASGLIALVDDSIRARFDSKNEKHLLIPVPKLHMGVEYVGPKQLIDNVFNRSSSQSRPSSSNKPPSSSRRPPSSRKPSYDG